MLIKGNDILGLKVISLKDGKRIEDINDLIYDPEEHRVKALLVEAGGLFSQAKVIPFESIKTIGRDAVIVESKEAIKKASELGRQVAHIIQGNTYLTNEKVITEDGNELGKVSDILFDDKTGEVKELEVSQGIKDFQSGKKHVKASDIVTIGEDATIVKTYTEEKFEKQGQRQGVQGAINQGKTAIDQTTRTGTAKISQGAVAFGSIANQKLDEVKADPRTKQTIDRVKRKTDDLVDRIKNKANEAKSNIQEQRIKDVLGKYLTVNILSPNNEMIAKHGDMVSQDIIEKAESAGLLEKVLNNASAEPLTT